MKDSNYGTDAYQQGFTDGMNVGHKYPQSLMIADYKFEKILELILKDQEKQSIKLCGCKDEYHCEFYAMKLKNCKRRIKMSDKIKVTLTRQAAADMLRRHTLEGHSNIDNMINFYVEAGMLEVVEEKSKHYVDWNMAIKLETYEGTKKAKYIGKNMNNKIIVEIQNDKEYREANQDGYVTGYDAWLSNYT